VLEKLLEMPFVQFCLGAMKKVVFRSYMHDTIGVHLVLVGDAYFRRAVLRFSFLIFSSDLIDW
jgi:hypothetical protein